MIQRQRSMSSFGFPLVDFTSPPQDENGMLKSNLEVYGEGVKFNHNFPFPSSLCLHITQLLKVCRLVRVGSVPPESGKRVADFL